MGGWVVPPVWLVVAWAAFLDVSLKTCFIFMVWFVSRFFVVFLFACLYGYSFVGLVVVW